MKKERFHERLVRIRLSRKMTAAAVASKTGVAPSTYRAWEYGRAIQGPEPFVLLAKTFEVSLHELLTGQAPKASGTLEHLKQAETLLREIKSTLLALD